MTVAMQYYSHISEAENDILKIKNHFFEERLQDLVAEGSKSR